MAFLSSTLAVVGACDKTPPETPPTGVTVGDPDGSANIPREVPGPTPEPNSAAKLPPRPDMSIPNTDCEPERTEMLALQKTFEEIHAETEALYAALPSDCRVSDDACVPKFKPIAKRFVALQERNRKVVGLCDCSAPIVADYRSVQRAEATRRIAFIRDRILAASKAQEEAEAKWNALVREEATPRPCLSCKMCEPKSACD